MAGLQKTKLEDLIDRFYEAATQPELWRTVLHELSLATGAEGALLHGNPGSTDKVFFSEGIDELCHTYISGSWVNRNPRPRRGMAVLRSTASIVTESMCFTEAELDRIPFNAELIERLGFRWFAGLIVAQSDGISLQLSLERRRRQGQFTDSELESLKRIVPHIQAAGQVALRLSDARYGGMLDAFNQMNCGGVLIDFLGRVLQMNQKAQHAMGNGLMLTQKHLSACHQPTDGLLQSLIRSVIHLRPAHESGPHPPVAVPRPMGSPLIVHAAPLEGSARDLFQHAKALLMIVDPDEHRRPAEPVLRQVFGFTPAEARLAMGLAAGQDLTEIAHSCRIKTATARIQLKAVFAKTRTHRQGELVAFLHRFTGPCGKCS